MFEWMSWGILLIVGCVLVLASVAAWFGSGQRIHSIHVHGDSKGVKAYGVPAIIVALALLASAIIPWIYRSQAPEKPPPGPTITIVQIFNILNTGVDRPTYKIEPFPNPEVICGQRGRYYTIDPRDATTTELVLFDLAKYTKDQFDHAFRQSMTDVRRDITAHLASLHVKYQIYVRGSADVLGARQASVGQLMGGANSKLVRFLVKSPDDPGQFLNVFSERRIPRRFTNGDLPNLRAQFISEALSGMGFESTILDGSVSTKIDENDRNATILLFIEWPAQLRGGQNGEFLGGVAAPPEALPSAHD